MTQKKSARLSCFGLSLDIDGQPVYVAESELTYFRNMCIEFLGRHFPDALWTFFPNIKGPWKWGKCADRDGLRKFFAQNCALRMLDNGDVEIYITTEVAETVYTPDRTKRMYINEIDLGQTKSAYGLKLPYPIDMTEKERSKFRNTCLDFIKECEPDRFEASFDGQGKSSKYGKVIDPEFQKINARKYTLSINEDEEVFIIETATERTELVHSLK